MIQGHLGDLNCRGDLLAGHACTECCLDAVLGTLGVCLPKWVCRVLSLSITVDQTEHVHHLEWMITLGFVQRGEFSLVKGSTPECRLGLEAWEGDSSFAPLQFLSLAP